MTFYFLVEKVAITEGIYCGAFVALQNNLTQSFHKSLAVPA